ncbi:MAG: hypothetical protein Sylvanvirus24_9 [Sylvanvirus sp.]|uniref:Uncharacterized protein n=1 Tax=Sylvanvirus sp. TaxID=2487774 RepID=A0A3G5AJS5_9VIRU|nr:MAG: hypothetical protein Sylvanvirus24_9 [Sylvanvirus sp.]
MLFRCTLDDAQALYIFRRTPVSTREFKLMFDGVYHQPNTMKGSWDVRRAFELYYQKHCKHDKSKQCDDSNVSNHNIPVPVVISHDIKLSFLIEVINTHLFGKENIPYWSILLAKNFHLKEECLEYAFFVCLYSKGIFFNPRYLNHGLNFDILFQVFQDEVIKFHLDPSIKSYSMSSMFLDTSPICQSAIFDKVLDLFEFIYLNYDICWKKSRFFNPLYVIQLCNNIFGKKAILYHYRFLLFYFTHISKYSNVYDVFSLVSIVHWHAFSPLEIHGLLLPLLQYCKHLDTKQFRSCFDCSRPNAVDFLMALKPLSDILIDINKDKISPPYYSSGHKGLNTFLYREVIDVEDGVKVFDIYFSSAEVAELTSKIYRPIHTWIRNDPILLSFAIACKPSIAADTLRWFSYRRDKDALLSNLKNELNYFPKRDNKLLRCVKILRNNSKRPFFYSISFWKRCVDMNPFVLSVLLIDKTTFRSYFLPKDLNLKSLCLYARSLTSCLTLNQYMSHISGIYSFFHDSNYLNRIPVFEYDSDDD